MEKGADHDPRVVVVVVVPAPRGSYFVCLCRVGLCHMATSHNRRQNNNNRRGVGGADKPPTLARTIVVPSTNPLPSAWTSMGTSMEMSMGTLVGALAGTLVGMLVGMLAPIEQCVFAQRVSTCQGIQQSSFWQ